MSEMEKRALKCFTDPTSTTARRFDEALVRYTDLIHERQRDQPAPTVKYLRYYIKITVGKRTHSFVRKHEGKVFRANNQDRPTGHSRGTIFNHREPLAATGNLYEPLY